MRSRAVCLPSKRFVGRGCQTRPALACHKYAGSLRINTTIFRSRAASPLAALLPYYTLKIRSIPSPVLRTGLGRQIYIENRQFSVSKDLPVIESSYTPRGKRTGNTTGKPTGGSPNSHSIKYVCPCCNNSVRATKAVHILCMDCNKPMQPQ